MSSTTDNHFTWIAPIYDVLAQCYSFGQISRSKLSQVAHIKPGHRVLYAGAGNAEDAIAAAVSGAQVTVVELSPNMLERAQRKALEAGVARVIDWQCEDIMAYISARANTEKPKFDVVVANYFLNVFDAETMPKVFDRLLEALANKGRVMVADFAPLSSGKVSRAFQKLYFFAAVSAFRLIAGNAWHPLYDYAALMTSRYLNVEHEQGFRLLGLGPAWYRSTIARKPESTNE